MLSRRDVLRAGAAVAVGRVGPRLPADDPGSSPFAHGVASGDPIASAVVLWTRVGGAVGDVTVRWVVAADAALTDVVAAGNAVAAADRDHTVHVDVDGLEPATTYHYGFEVDGVRSPTGRTRTGRLPADLEEVRVGACSCSSYAAGPFAVYRHLAEADVDLVVHLGDYLYDTGGGPRRHDPRDAPVSLADYRRRHAQQRSDPDLRRLHASHPVAAVWDDHDVAGNAWRDGADAHDDDEHGPWAARRAAGLQAWLEWLPVRLPDPARPERIWRSLQLGGAADLLLLDTRHDGRDEQVGSGGAAAGAELADPERRLLSAEQEAWAADTLATSTATWRVLGNQVVLTPLGFAVPDSLASPTGRLGLTVDGLVVNPDAWDGYPPARERLLAAVAAATGPTVVLTGDVHSSWAFEVPDASGAPVAVEWVTPSVTAQPFAEIVGLPSPALAPTAVELIAGQLPQVRWAELTQHGYLVASFAADEARCDWWHVDLDDGTGEVAASWSVAPATPRLETSEPLPPRASVRPGPPAVPGPTTTVAGRGDGGEPWWRGSGAQAAGGAGAVALALVVGIRRRRTR